MDNVTIINTKPNDLEFDLELKGMDASNMKVRFIIETNDVEFGFNCSKQEDSKWAVTIPTMSSIENTTYPFRIDVVVDGYYFEGFRGTLTVATDPELYSTAPQNKTFAPAPTSPVTVQNDTIDRGRLQVASESDNNMSAEKIAEKIVASVDATKPDDKSSAVKKAIADSSMTDKKKKVTTKKKKSTEGHWEDDKNGEPIWRGPLLRKYKKEIKESSPDAKKSNATTTENDKVKQILESLHIKKPKEKTVSVSKFKKRDIVKL